MKTHPICVVGTISILFVGITTAVFYYSRPDSVLFSVLIYLLFPGNMVSIAITGGHGGTQLQELIAPLAGFIVNVTSYFLVFGLLYLAWLRKGVPK